MDTEAVEEAAAGPQAEEEAAAGLRAAEEAVMEAAAAAAVEPRSLRSSS